MSVPCVRVATPTVLQMEAVECGAAALAIVLAYHGRWVPLEALRLGCGVSRNGSKASNLLKCARAHGLLARGFSKDKAQAVAALPVPSILHWNFNHFLVFEGMHEGKVYLNDPACGPRIVTPEELEESFTGVVLVFETGPEFVPAGAPPALLRELAYWLRHSHAAVALVALASLLLVVPGLLLPLFAKVFIDQVLVAQQQHWLAPLLWAMLAALGVRSALTYLQQRYLLRLQLKLAISMSSRLLDHVLRLPLGFFSQRQAGEVANRVGAAERVAQLLSGELATQAFNLVAMLSYGLVMLAVDWPLALLSMALLALNLAGVRRLARGQDDVSARLLGEQGKLAGATVGAIAGIESLKAGGAEDAAFARWAGYQAAALASCQQLGRLAAQQAVLPLLMTALTTAAVLGLGGLRVMQGALTLGDLVAFQALLAAFALPLSHLVALAGEVRTVKGLLTRLADLLRYPLPPVVPASAVPARTAGLLELRQVCFAYSPVDPPQVREVSLRLAPGMRVALVGASGSGKSTLGRLCCGLLQPSSGAVLLDGVALDAIAPADFAQLAAYVDQDGFLFEGSLRDNLTLWDDTVDDQQLRRALEDACIWEAVARRPAGLDSRVDEGGLNWSGGERQRLELARALVRNPRLLILDEATAALDTVTEQAIDAALRRRGCSCIIIAHRLSTLRDSDEIIVLHGGAVVERGNHQALLALGSHYSALAATL